MGEITFMSINITPLRPLKFSTFINKKQFSFQVIAILIPIELWENNESQFSTTQSYFKLKTIWIAQ